MTAGAAKMVDGGMPVLDVQRLRADFPTLDQEVRGKRLVYLDNAATSQTPQVVIDALNRYYVEYCSNVHRGAHRLSELATRDYEESRGKIQKFINAPTSEQILFCRGTTEAINLVANTYGQANVKAGDEVVVSQMEHHSNIVPWQLLCERQGATLKVIPINDAGELLMEEYEKLLGPKTRLVAVNHVSNALGTVNPVEEIIRLAHAREIPVLLDGAQAIPHQPVDVQKLDCEFYAFSGHKMCGPTGIGVLYGKTDLLNSMPVFQGGGDMIETVTFEKTTYNDLPYKFEAGTPNISGAIGLGAAVDYLTAVGMDKIAAYEASLLSYATERLNAVEGLRLVGTAQNKAGVCSFVWGDFHPQDIGTLLDHEGVAIRAGHHCAQPVMQRLGLAATARASFAFYNTHAEVDALIVGLERVREVFGQ